MRCSMPMWMREDGRASFNIAHLFMQMKILNSTEEFNYNIYMTNYSKSSTGLIYANEERQRQRKRGGEGGMSLFSLKNHKELRKCLLAIPSL